MSGPGAVLSLLLVVLAPWVAGAGDLSWGLDDSFGETGRGRNELREPVDLAVTREGLLAVLDRDRESVVLFSGTGRWLRTLGGTRGVGDLSLRRPSAIACDGEDRLWVSDTGNHRLVVVDLEGTVVKTVGSLGSAGGRFRHPADLVFDGRGRLYVADQGNERIQVFTADGSFLAAWERRTSERRDHLESPAALAFTEQGQGGLWVANRGWTRLERFDAAGEWEESLELPKLGDTAVEVAAVTVEPAFYRMFVADAAGSRVLALDRRGALISEVSPPEGPFRPGGLAVSRRMEIYVADAAGARVLKFKTR